MTVKDVKDVLKARVLTGEDLLDQEVRSACGSDMMSDVLAFSKDHSVLLTGLCNPQVIRTAEIYLQVFLLLYEFPVYQYINIRNQFLRRL